MWALGSIWKPAQLKTSTCRPISQMPKWNYRRQMATRITWGINKSKQCLPTNQPLEHLNGCSEKAPSTSALKHRLASQCFPQPQSSLLLGKRRENSFLLPCPSGSLLSLSTQVAKFYSGSLHILNAGSGYGQTRSENTLLSKDGGALGKDRGWNHATSGR